MSEVNPEPYPSKEGLANIQRFMKAVGPNLAELKISRWRAAVGYAGWMKAGLSTALTRGRG